MNDDLFDELVGSIKEAGQILRGEVRPARATTFEALDIRAVREKLELPRAKFSRLLGVSERTLEGWEQGRRRPTGAARTLLNIADKHPEVLLEQLKGG